ncbi:MAG: DUF1638 domain-containing protein [Hasllibacter sp.]
MAPPSGSARRGGRAARLAERPAAPATDLTDAALTARGYDSGDPAPLLILACGALGREIAGLIRANGWTHARLHCLPAILHNHPGRIAPAAAAALDAIPHERAVLAYADCGTGGDLARLCAEREIEMLPGAHCYAFYEGVETFGQGDMRAFYVTDFLVRQFDAFVTRPLGLDRNPGLAADYFKGYERLIYQAQTDDPALTAEAERIAGRFGWAFERRATGLGDLSATLGRLA